MTIWRKWVRGRGRSSNKSLASEFGAELRVKVAWASKVYQLAATFAKILPVLYIAFKDAVGGCWQFGCCLVKHAVLV